MTQNATDEDLAAGLVGLSTGLASDGYELNATWQGDRIALTVAAGPDACADCLVPKTVMADIAVSMLSSAGVSVTADDIEIAYPEGSAAH